MLTDTADDTEHGHDQVGLASEFELEVYLAACALVLSWELEDPRDAWKHTGGPRPDANVGVIEKPPYRAPQATVDAFFFLVRLGDADRLRRWIDQHPLDAPELYRLWEDKNART